MKWNSAACELHVYFISFHSVTNETMTILLAAGVPVGTVLVATILLAVVLLVICHCYHPKKSKKENEDLKKKTELKKNEESSKELSQKNEELSKKEEEIEQMKQNSLTSRGIAANQDPSEGVYLLANILQAIAPVVKDWTYSEDVTLCTVHTFLEAVLAEVKYNKCCQSETKSCLESLKQNVQNFQSCLTKRKTECDSVPGGEFVQPDFNLLKSIAEKVESTLEDFSQKNKQKVITTPDEHNLEVEISL